MKKKLLTLLLSIAVILTSTVTVFADDSYEITNGTPESAKETNHGYITIDKHTAEEDETVTITVNPSEGYRLKSLTVVPEISTIADVLATIEGGFPFSDDQAEPSDNAWVADVKDNKKCYAYTTISGSITALLLRIPAVGESKANFTYLLATKEVTPGKNSYTTQSSYGTLTFNMTNGVLTSFTHTRNEGKIEDFDGTYFPVSTPSARLIPITLVNQEEGTYQFQMPAVNVTVTAEFEVTIADILPSNFPASDEDNSWCESVNGNVYIYKKDSNLVFNDKTDDCYSVPLSSSLTKKENPEVIYVYSVDGTEIQFNMTGDNNDELEKIVVNNCTIPTCIGTYAAPKTFSVTYNANGATSGSAPADQTKTSGVGLTLDTNTGNLAKTDYTFNGWNTKADGSGTHYDTGANYTTDAALTLYAEWTGASATKTIADILPKDFPSTTTDDAPEDAWVNNSGDKAYINKINEIVFERFPATYDINTVLTEDDGDYKASITGGQTLTFKMKSNVLEKIECQLINTVSTFAPYKIENAQNEATSGSTEDMEFKTNANYQSTPSNVTVKVQLEGETSPTTLTYDTDYSLQTGSTIVKLKGDYVKTLPIGTHTISIAVAGYKEVSQNFKITTAPTPTPTPNPGSGSSGYKIPKTGIE